jgi:hypothetical protein
MRNILSTILFLLTSFDSLSAQLIGEFRTSCEDPLYGFNIKMFDNNTALVAINSNQIYVHSLVSPISDELYDFTLSKPADLGRGGMNLNWGGFSDKKSMMQLQKFDNKKYMLTWFGFWDKNKSSYTWTTDKGLQGGPELEGKVSYFYNCSN